MKNLENEIWVKAQEFVYPDLLVNNTPWCQMAKEIEEIINEKVWTEIYQNIDDALSQNLPFFDIFNEKTNSIWQKKMQKERSKKW